MDFFGWAVQYEYKLNFFLSVLISPRFMCLLFHFVLWISNEPALYGALLPIATIEQGKRGYSSQNSRFLGF